MNIRENMYVQNTQHVIAVLAERDTKELLLLC